jgi:hypothetical protein
MSTATFARVCYTAGIISRLLYFIGVPVTYIYLTVHDWPVVSGWVWLWMDVYNGFRAVFWPLYFILSLFFFHGPLPVDRA